MKTHACLALILASPLAFGDTSIGQYEREAVSVASGTTAIDGVVAVADDARLVKTGAGTVTLNVENLVSPNAPHIDVLAGTLGIGSNGGTPVTPTVPAIIQNSATLWLAADDGNAHFATSSSGDDTCVDIWRDVRDTAASATNFPFAATPIAVGFVSPFLQTVDGSRGVYFRGYKSKCTMLLHKADGTSYAAGSQKVAAGTVFAVTRIANCWGNMLGNYVDTTAVPHVYHLSDYNSGKVAFTSYHANMRNPVMRTMRFFDNGESRDHNRDHIQKGLRVIEYCHSAGAKGAFDSLFGQGRTNNREGGDHLMELIVFDAALSEADRLAVEGYLAAKWGIAATTVDLRLSEGATATISSSDLTVMPSGRGVIEAAASGLMFATGETPDFGGAVKIAPGVTARLYGSDIALALESGDSLNVALADNTTDFGRKAASVTKTAAAGTAEKTGAGTARIAALPADVAQLDVKGGRVILAARTMDAPPPCGTSDIHATIPNHDFESSDMSGWTLTQDGERWTGRRRRSDQTTLTPVDTPQGTYFLMLKRGGSDAEGVPAAQTTVAVPVTGRYELTFLASGRKDYGRGMFHVEFVSGGDTLTCDETDCFWINGNNWRKHHVLTPELAAGNWTMRIVPNFAVWDTTSNLDDFHMTLVTERIAADGTWRIPNGGFEEIDYLTSDNATYWTGNNGKNSFNDPDNTRANVVSGWTLVNGGSFTTGAPDVGSVDESMFDYGNWYYASPYLCRWGKKALGFWSSHGTATSAAFSPPAGRWQLRFKSAFAGSQNGATGATFWHGNALWSNPSWSVTVSVNGSPALTETSAVCGHNKWKTAVLDGTFDTAAGDSVTITISQTADRGAGYIDDIELVPANLVQNSGFETGALGAWSGGSVNAYNNSNIVGTFGEDVCDGSYYLQIQGTTAASQSMSVPEAGLYRIGLKARTATGTASVSNGYMFDPLEIRVMQGATTNFIARADADTDTFRPYSWWWNVPAPGSYTLVIAGTVAARKYTLVDEVSVVKCDAGIVDVAPNISSAVTLGVAAGAEVALDFPGTLELFSLRLGGHKPQGEYFSAATHPEYFTGTGTLFVKPKATVLYVR